MSRVCDRCEEHENLREVPLMGKTYDLCLKHQDTYADLCRKLTEQADGVKKLHLEKYDGN